MKPSEIVKVLEESKTFREYMARNSEDVEVNIKVDLAKIVDMDKAYEICDRAKYLYKRYPKMDAVRLFKNQFNFDVDEVRKAFPRVRIAGIFTLTTLDCAKVMESFDRC